MAKWPWDWQPQAAVCAEGNSVTVAPKELELWKMNPLTDVPLKTASQAVVGPAGRELGDQYSDFSLLQSFSLPWSLPLADQQSEGKEPG